MKRAIADHSRDFLAIIVLVVLAAGIGGYILENQRLRFPFVEDKPKVIQVELENAQAVTPGQGQTVRVAGVEIGAIGAVELEDGVAVVDMEIEPEYENLIRSDATVLLRPKTALKDMFLEVEPGGGKPLEAESRIQLANTAPDVNPDEFFSALDADTRDYLKLLITSGAEGLEGRGEDLRQTLRRLEPLHRDLAAVNTAVAGRRVELKRLIRDYGETVEELSGKDEELTELVVSSNEVFSALAEERVNVQATIRGLTPALRQTEQTLSRVDTLGERLGPALNALRPPFRRLDETNAAVRPFVREATPIVRDQLRPFARQTQPFVADLGRAATDTVRALPDITKSFGQVNRFFNMGAFNPGGAEELTGDLEVDRDREEGFFFWLAWAAQNGVSIHNTSDATGVHRRLTLCGADVSGSLEQLTDATEQLTGPLTEELARQGLPVDQIEAQVSEEVTGLITRVATSGFGICEF